MESSYCCWLGYCFCIALADGKTLLYCLKAMTSWAAKAQDDSLLFFMWRALSWLGFLGLSPLLVLDSSRFSLGGGGQIWDFHHEEGADFHSMTLYVCEVLLISYLQDFCPLLSNIEKKIITFDLSVPKIGIKKFQVQRLCTLIIPWKSFLLQERCFLPKTQALSIQSCCLINNRRSNTIKTCR